MAKKLSTVHQTSSISIHSRTTEEAASSSKVRSTRWTVYRTDKLLYSKSGPCPQYERCWMGFVYRRKIKFLAEDASAAIPRMITSFSFSPLLWLSNTFKDSRGSILLKGASCYNAYTVTRSPFVTNSFKCHVHDHLSKLVMEPAGGLSAGSCLRAI